LQRQEDKKISPAVQELSFFLYFLGAKRLNEPAMTLQLLQPPSLAAPH